MPKLDKAAKYRISLFDKAHVLKIKGIRKTMSNAKLEKLIQETTTNAQKQNLLKEADRIGIYVPADVELGQLRKIIAHAKGEKILVELKKKESSEKDELIAEGKILGIKISKRLDIDSMKQEIEKQKRRLKDQAKKKPYIDKAAELGIEANYTMTISKLKNIITAEMKKLEENNRKTELMAEAKAEGIKNVKMSMTRKEMSTYIAGERHEKSKKTKEYKFKQTKIDAAVTDGAVDASHDLSLAEIKIVHTKHLDKIAAKEKKAAERKAKKLKEKNDRIEKEVTWRKESIEKHSESMNFVEHHGEAASIEKDLITVEEKMNDLIEKISAVSEIEKLKSFSSKAKTKEVKDAIKHLEVEYSEKETQILNELIGNEKKLGKIKFAEFKAEESIVVAKVKKLASQYDKKAKSLLKNVKTHTEKVHTRNVELKVAHTHETKKHREKTKLAASEKIKLEKRNAILLEGSKYGFVLTDETLTNARLNTKVKAHIAKIKHAENKLIAEKQAKIDAANKKKRIIADKKIADKEAARKVVKETKAKKVADKVAARKAIEKMNAKKIADKEAAIKLAADKDAEELVKQNKLKELELKELEKQRKLDVIANEKLEAERLVAEKHALKLAKKEEKTHHARRASKFGVKVDKRWSTTRIHAEIKSAHDKYKVSLAKAKHESSEADKKLSVAVHNKVVFEKEFSDTKAMLTAQFEIDLKNEMEQFSTVENNWETKVSKFVLDQDKIIDRLAKRMNNAGGGIRKYKFLDDNVKVVISKDVESRKAIETKEVVKVKVAEKQKMSQPVATTRKDEPKILTMSFSTRELFMKTKKSNKWKR